MSLVFALADILFRFLVPVIIIRDLVVGIKNCKTCMFIIVKKIQVHKPFSDCHDAMVVGWGGGLPTPPASSGSKVRGLLHWATKPVRNLCIFHFWYTHLVYSRCYTM